MRCRVAIVTGRTPDMNPGVGIPVFAHDHCASLSNPRAKCCRRGNWIPIGAGGADPATLLDVVRPRVTLMTDSAADMMGGLAVDIRLEQFSTLLGEPCAERGLGGSRVLPGARDADTPNGHMAGHRYLHGGSELLRKIAGPASQVHA
jgi:hypothetical protein